MLPKFELVVPSRLDEAVGVLAEVREKARVLAGGTDLLVLMRAGQVKPQYLVDIKRLSELKQVGYSPDGTFVIGALATHRDLETSCLVQKKFSILHDGVSRVGSVQIRNRATVGGNICNALPCADSVGPLLALGARLKLQGPMGEREVLLEEFILGPRKTVLATDEILTAILVPPGTGQGAYIKFTKRKAMDLAVLGVSVYLEYNGDDTCHEVRIALTTAAPIPIRAREAEASLKGQVPTDEALERAGAIAAREARPRTSWRSTEEYRRALLQVLVPRAGKLARQRLLNS